ncbi:MAG: tetratricopeptide repeat protein [Ardenticatenaceae bacterium]
MTLITIRETSNNQATVSFDRQGEFSITVCDPFSSKEEERLEWYFERWPQFPFVQQVKAQSAAQSVLSYGERLFEQVFKADFGLYGRYSQARRAGGSGLRFEIVGSPEFQRLHWEALKDPELPRPFVLDALMVRCVLTPAVIEAKSQRSPTINLLLVVARPSGGRDVGFRTISRPLVESLREIRQPVRIEILRPGTYKALLEHLRAVRDEHGVGFYHIIHFDLHGALMTHEQIEQGIKVDRYLYQQRFGRADLPRYEGQKAFLFFEAEQEGQADPASASEVAHLLIQHQIPIAILNACQSGKQTGTSESSLASRLMTAGVQTVLAMAYSVTVSAAKLMMTTLYRQLLQENELAVAIRHAREALYNHKARGAYFDQLIDLEDWLLPIVYQSGGAQSLSSLPLRKPTPAERQAYYLKRATRYQALEPEYGFVGRDVDILHIEKRLLAQSEGKQRNLLLIRGMGGAGKTTLLQHLGVWWQTTHFVNEVFYFGYEQKAWTLEQIMHQLATKTIAGPEQEIPLGEWTSYPLEIQQEILADHLRATRHLLILDNLESITGENLAIPNTLPPDEREALRTFLAKLLNGQTFVLLGTRGGEAWLTTKGPLRPIDIYDLPGLDKEAASTLAERILARHVSDNKKRDQYRQSTEFNQLLKLLDGYPLALEVVLSNLARQTPTEIWQALQAGDDAIDFKSQDKTKSILRCIEYSHSNLSADAQKLLLCLAPFTSVICTAALEKYTEHLCKQPLLANLPFERWTEVIQEAVNWGLLKPMVEQDGYMRVHPTFPYFLRHRFHKQEKTKQAGEIAFQQYYYAYAEVITQFIRSQNEGEKLFGENLVRLEYLNLLTALHLALDAQAPIFHFYYALSLYADTIQDHTLGLEFGRIVLKHASAWQNFEDRNSEYFSVVDDIAKRRLLLFKYKQAEEAYRLAGYLISKNTTLDTKTKEISLAGVVYQLGMTASHQRKWEEAEKYYQEALKIYRFHDELSQIGRTYHALGALAIQQSKLKLANDYLQKALECKVDAENELEMASTYGQLAILHTETGEWNQAIRYCLQAMKTYIKFGEQYKQGKIYFQLGKIHNQQQAPQKAQNYFQKALAVFIHFEDLHHQAIVYCQLGTLAEKEGQYSQAKDYYLRALDIFSTRDVNLASSVLRSLATLPENIDSMSVTIAPILEMTSSEVKTLLRQATKQSSRI